jgi:hypothetical protein
LLALHVTFLEDAPAKSAVEALGKVRAGVEPVHMGRKRNLFALPRQLRQNQAL